MTRTAKSAAARRLFFLLLAASPAPAADHETLKFFEEEAQGITASRRLEPVRKAPGAVEIITADDIRRSGAVNIWDLMRFRAGIDVIDARSGDGNRASVSIRGFPAEFVDMLLVLLDGRSVYNGLSGGTVWEDLPVSLEDIERIEIVRGPNAALYGSNAGLGVINIITKKPQPAMSASAGALWGNRGLDREQAAVEGGGALGAVRLSAVHKALEGNPLAAGGKGNDFLYKNKGNVRAVWTPDDKSAVELFCGGSWETLGVMDPASPASRGRFRNDFEMVRYMYEASQDATVEAMAARRDDVRAFDPNFLGVLTAAEEQYDAELVHKRAWLDGRAHGVYGGSFRYVSVDSSGIFLGKPAQWNSIRRGFVSQSWSARPELTLTGSASLENSENGGTEPAYQAAAVFTPATGHTLRFSYGLAPTIPTFYDRAANQLASKTVLLVGNPNYAPQRLRLYEAGYQASLLENHLLIENNLYYMTIAHLSETVVKSYVFPLLTLTFDNANSAIARGDELKATYRWSARRSVYANYARETISDAKGSVNVKRGTPVNKVNLGGTTDLGFGFSVSANAGWKDGHTLTSQATNQTLDFGGYWRVDARLAYAIPGRDAEVYVAGQNLLVPAHLEFPEGLSVPRTYMAGISVRFGGKP